MLPNWVFGLILFAPFPIGYLIICRVEFHREQSYLKAVFDGDRIWSKQNRKHKPKLAARHGRYFT